MPSFSPLADPPASSGAEPEFGSKEKPFDLTAPGDGTVAEEDVPVLPPLEKPTEFVMGPRQLASLAFVAIFVLGVMSAVAYFAGRKNTAPPPQITERVIERVVAAPAVSVPPPVVAETKTVAVPAPLPDPKTKAEVVAPQLNQFYLQLGSVEVGVAEIMVEGLRQRGMQSIVGLGVNNKVARILVGPFNTPAEQQAAQKRVEDMGFHPFPRMFTPKDLEQQQMTPPPAAPAPIPAKP
jgi:hypothetical protein